MSQTLRGECGWAYVAGFFDGEGHIRPDFGHLVFTQTTRPVLEAISEFFSSMGIRSAIYSTKKKREGWAPYTFRLYVTKTDDCVTIMRGMRPWLIVKNQPVEDAARSALAYPPKIKSRLPYCKHGHPLSGDNLGISRSSRVCLACKREWHRKWRARNEQDAQGNDLVHAG